MFLFISAPVRMHATPAAADTRRRGGRRLTTADHTTLSARTALGIMPRLCSCAL
jgi:hypothetical protein